jgi:hypothetical protein
MDVLSGVLMISVNDRVRESFAQCDLNVAIALSRTAEAGYRMDIRSELWLTVMRRRAKCHLRQNLICQITALMAELQESPPDA